MKLKKLLITSSLLALIACGKNGAQKDAEEVCDCWKESAKSNDSLAVDCLTLYIKLSKKHEKNAEDSEIFNETFEGCSKGLLDDKTE